MFINKSNKLIQNISFDLTTLELKVLSKIISMIDSKAKNFKRYYEFEIKDFREELKENYHEENQKHHYDTNYTKIKKAVENLSDKGFRIIKNNGDTEVYTRWLTSVITEKHTGKITVEIPSEMKNYYLDLNENYTSYQAKYIYKLRSKYSIRIYELLHSHKNKLTKKNKKLEITYNLKEFRKILDLSDSKYKRYNNFRINVLEIAKKELKEKALDFQFDYYTIGRGERKTIVFVIKNIKKEREKQEAEKKQELINNSDNIDKQIYTDIEKTLKDGGVSKSVRNSLISNFDEMRIRRNIEMQYTRLANKKITRKELPGALVKSIKEDWAMGIYEENKIRKQNKEESKNTFDKPLPIEPKNNPTEAKIQQIETDEALKNDFIDFLFDIGTPKAKTLIKSIAKIGILKTYETKPHWFNLVDKFWKLRE